MIRTLNLMFWFTLSIMASIALYHTSDRTRELEQQLTQINAAVEGEQEKIHVLNAEWVYLANPERVTAEAKKFLQLRATTPQQVVGMNDLDRVLPLQPQTQPTQTAAAAPVIAPQPTRISAKEPVKAAPMRVAQAVPAQKPMPLPEHHPRKIAVKVADRPYINDHMVIEHAAASHPTDEIGSLIAGLDAHQ